MGKAFNDFQFKAEKDLRSASEGEPRELWNILNNLNKSTSKRDEIDLDNLYEYFKNLNIDKHPDDDDDEFILPNCDDDFHIMAMARRLCMLVLLVLFVMSLADAYVIYRRYYAPRYYRSYAPRPIIYTDDLDDLDPVYVIKG
ncbi:Hypothetical predicted protein [Mytilus galloprovincialis]|uniref:Uncharacterized protein n=1 Tax=Mytilus galloprovincialis TaxID=29158 RepID=A0A8B6FIB2_MYTGA|nr:Hypothetical predicted protein [Mytilus galloprovincialis]